MCVHILKRIKFPNTDKSWINLQASNNLRAHTHTNEKHVQYTNKNFIQQNFMPETKRKAKPK